VKLAIIVAVARNNVIGCDNQLPWRIPGELQYFKAKTLGKPIIMGRKTHESIGRILPGRLNIVVSRSAPKAREDQLVWVSSLEEALVLAAREQPQAEEVMVMGGEQIYRQSLPMADRIYLTRVDVEPEGDAWFPELAESEWQLAEESPGAPNAPVGHVFQRFERRKN